MSQKILDRLQEKFPDAVLSTSSFRGDESAIIKRERALDVLRFLHDDSECQLDMARTMTAIDWLGRDGDRFEVVYQLYSITLKHGLRVKVPVSEDDASIDTCTTLWPGMNWAEREIWDMYGIKFRGHPDLRRMFMYEEFVGHPLRKDYPKERRQPLIRREGMV
jgi:NADH-quinone oxidoreductase subunit C